MPACTFYCAQPPRAKVTQLLCPHRDHEGAGSPHPIRVGGPDLWYQMALADTTVEQSLASSSGGTRGREFVRCEGGSPRGGKRWMKGWVRLGRETMGWAGSRSMDEEGREDGQRWGWLWCAGG